MKRYYSRSVKLLAIVSLDGVAVLLTGIAFLFINIVDIWLSICLTVVGGLFGVLFLVCFVAEKSRTLLIDANKIILPRGATINGKMAFQKTVIKMCEIQSIECCLRKGDGIISKDTYFYILNLIDNRKVTVTLYAYGKEAEREIIETIKKKVV